MSREYHYVGPDEIRQQALKRLPGVRILTLEDLVNWIDRTDTDRLFDGTVVATYAISIHRELQRRLSTDDAPDAMSETL